MPVKPKRRVRTAELAWGNLAPGDRFLLTTGINPTTFDKAVLIRSVADLQQARLDNPDLSFPEAVVPEDVTADWVRNRSDELAVAAGCRFDVARGAYAVWWIETHCKLYEGSGAGRPMILRGCAQCGDYGLPPHSVLERAARYAECVRAGHRLDWQYECIMRLFGWVRWSDQWRRFVRRFREASIWVAKKNKKSPTLAAISLHLLCADGEPGQKVFLGAKDGQQARGIAGRHAIEMVMQSDGLQCTINKVESKITHEPSRSILLPLSSSNETTQKSKEGLNGSVLIDECHVVDREFINRISRAGISRAEPLHAEFSTTGDDPDSYGKERFDYASRVLRGEHEDQALFVAIYAAPQDLKDEDLRADPVRYGKMANPSWGHTIDPDEFMADWEKSKDSPARLAGFKMYRLNLWQNAATPWLNPLHWSKGERAFNVADFHGRECWGALDLSSVKDFTALCLAFPEADDFYSLLWWFWLPQETAVEYRNLIPIDAWLSDRRVNLTLTDGARIDFGYIRSKFRELATRFKIRELAYDDWNAEQTTAEICEGVRDQDGRVIEPGTGIPRLNFSQALKAMNEPTKRFEASVIDGKVLHNGDPLTRWQIQNATIRPDCNGNYKPLKPGAHSVKKIDAVITAVMALARARVKEGKKTSVYENRGIIVLGA